VKIKGVVTDDAQRLEGMTARQWKWLFRPLKGKPFEVEIRDGGVLIRQPTRYNLRTMDKQPGRRLTGLLATETEVEVAIKETLL
jgi:hypothetical protein